MPDREVLRETFDGVAHLYAAARPTYPEALFDDLVELTAVRPGDRLLEIGCGPGTATRPLLERGFRVVCVELGARLAGEAQRNLAGLPAEVQVGRFEQWEPDARDYSLVYAATAWRWVDPASRYAKAHELLRAGGHLAFWHQSHGFPAGFDPFFAELQEVYDELGEGRAGEWPPPEPQDVADDSAEIEASRLFTVVAVRRYVWETLYTAAEYVALLSTFSGHIAMEPGKREHLFAEIRRRIDARSDPRIRRHWLAILHVARRLDEPSRRYDASSSTSRRNASPRAS